MEARVRNLLFDKVKNQENEKTVEVVQLPHTTRRGDVKYDLQIPGGTENEKEAHI